MSTIFSNFAQSGSICVLGGVTKKTKWKPVLRINFFLALSNGLSTRTASVGARPDSFDKKIINKKSWNQIYQKKENEFNLSK